MSRILTFILIILIFPTFVTAHEGEEHLEEGTVMGVKTEAGVLPGEVFYFADQLGEWIEVNLLTLSTRKKQAKLLEFTDERMAELEELERRSVDKPDAYGRAFAEYKKDLNRAEDMAEKLLILDGSLIGIAEQFERLTFDYEVFLHDLLFAADPDKKDEIDRFMEVTREQNQKMFEFMVTNYQFDETDIEKHVAIARRHLLYVVLELEELGFDQETQNKILQNLEEAEEHLADGLSAGAYERIDRVKDLLYFNLTN